MVGLHLLGSGYFPSFSEGLSLRADDEKEKDGLSEFPFLFGGTFIEGRDAIHSAPLRINFPSFSEGLSLRGRRRD